MQERQNSYPVGGYYGMDNVSGNGNGFYGAGAAAAGAAGIGVVRARSQRNDAANGLKEGNAPYPAFATATGVQQHPDYNPYASNTPTSSPPPHQQSFAQYRNDSNPYAAAAMGAGVGATAGAGAAAAYQHPHQAYANQPLQSSYADARPRSTSPPVYSSAAGGPGSLARMNTQASKSSGGHSIPNSIGSANMLGGNPNAPPAAAAGTGAVPPIESYASHYSPTFNPATYQPSGSRYDIPAGAVAAGSASGHGHGHEDPYVAAGGAYDEGHSPGNQLPNPFSRRGDTDEEDEDGYDGYEAGSGEGEYSSGGGNGGRVLKVANAD
jgi:hypothetical protein